MGDRRGSILFAFPNQKTKVTNEKFGRTKMKKTKPCGLCRYLSITYEYIFFGCLFFFFFFLLLLLHHHHHHHHHHHKLCNQPSLIRIINQNKGKENQPYRSIISGMHRVSQLPIHQQPLLPPQSLDTSDEASPIYPTATLQPRVMCWHSPHDDLDIHQALAADFVLRKPCAHLHPQNPPWLSYPSHRPPATQLWEAGDQT